MAFEIVNQTDYLLVKLNGECSGDEKPDLVDSCMKSMEEHSMKNFIFQFGDSGAPTLKFLRQMSLVYKESKAKNGMIRVIGANDSVKNLIVSNGLDRILVMKMSLRGALMDMGLVKGKDFDVNFINPFLNATQKVFKIQCFMDIKPHKPYLKKPEDPLLMGDVSGIISIVSEAWTGTLAISLTEAIFKGIATNMLGEPCEAVTDQNIDLVGELSNIILGQAKVELGGLGYGVQMAIPSCVWGKDHKVKHFGNGVCIVLPFDTPFGTMYVEIMTNNPALAALTQKK